MMDALLARIGAFIARERLLTVRASPCSRSPRAAPTRRCSCTRSPGSATRSRSCTSRTRCAARTARRTRVAVAALADDLGAPLHARRRARSPTAPISSAARGTCAAPRPTSSPTAVRSRRGTRATTGSRRSSTASPARPGRAAFRALPPSDGAGRVRPLLELGRRGGARRRSPPRASPGATTPRTTIGASRACRARLDLVPAFRSLHPAADQNLLRTAAQLVDQQARARRRRRRAALPRTGLRSMRARPPRRRPSSRGPRSAGSPARRRRPPPASSARSSSATGVRARAACRSGPGRVAERRYGIVRVLTDAPAPAPPESAPLCVSGRTPFGSLAVSCRAVAEGLDPALAEGAHVRAARPGRASRRQARDDCPHAARGPSPAAAALRLPRDRGRRVVSCASRASPSPRTRAPARGSSSPWRARDDRRRRSARSTPTAWSPTS